MALALCCSRVSLVSCVSRSQTLSQVTRPKACLSWMLIVIYDLAGRVRHNVAWYGGHGNCKISDSNVIPSPPLPSLLKHKRAWHKQVRKHALKGRRCMKPWHIMNTIFRGHGHAWPLRRFNFSSFDRRRLLYPSSGDNSRLNCCMQGQLDQLSYSLHVEEAFRPAWRVAVQYAIGKTQSDSTNASNSNETSQALFSSCLPWDRLVYGTPYYE